MSSSQSRVWQYIRLMRLERPIGWLLLLWPTLWALWIAGDGNPPAGIVLIFVTGVIVMRAAGCIVNDYADRHMDGHVERTKDRPLASGAITVKEAWGLFVLLGLLAFGLVLQLNALTIKLSFIALFVAATYPFLKRFTHFPQFYLGIAFSWGIPMAFSAIGNQIPPEAWMLLAANLCWTVAYDTLYAMSDRPDDIKIGIKSTAILFGRYDLALISLFYGISFLLMFLLGRNLDLNQYFYIGLGIAAMVATLLVFQSRSRERLVCFQAFINNSWIGGIIFAGILLAYL
jgi:4-hydroxybenzoate polyprenyltransferase